jgi:hypothetical protein
MGGDPYPVIFTSTGIDVYWKGTDGNLWHEWYSDGHGWEGPVSLGAGPLGSDPHPVVPATGRVSVFWKGKDNNLWEKVHFDTTGWQAPQTLGSGPLNSDPQPVSPASGVIDVYWRGTDNALWHNWYRDGSGWAGARGIAGTAGRVTAPPAPISSPSSFWPLRSPARTSHDPWPISGSPGHFSVFAHSVDATCWFQTTSGSGSPPA